MVETVAPHNQMPHIQDSRAWEVQGVEGRVHWSPLYCSWCISKHSLEEQNDWYYSDRDRELGCSFILLYVNVFPNPHTQYSPWCIFLATLSTINQLEFYGFISGFSILFHPSMCLFLYHQRGCLGYNSFVVYLEVR